MKLYWRSNERELFILAEPAATCAVARLDVEGWHLSCLGLSKVLPARCELPTLKRELSVLFRTAISLIAEGVIHDSL